MPNINNHRAVRAFEKLTNAGIDITYEDDVKICFDHEYQQVTYWIKKQWFSGKTVTDGRGIDNLIKQVTN